MSIIKNENVMLNFIKYGPIVFVLVISILVTIGFINHQNNQLEKEIEKTKTEYTKNHKQRVKDEVKRFVNIIKLEKGKAERKLKEQLKQRVYEAHKIATNLHNDKSDLKTIKTALSSISFNDGRGYIFIDDINGKKILHPIKSLEGKNLLEFEDAKGYKFVKKITQTTKNKTESYDTYYWYKGTDTTKSYKKIGFYKYFEPYNVAIGTGEYLDDFEKTVQKNILDRVKTVRIGKSGYIFVSDTKGLVLSHIKQKMIGVNMYNKKNKNGEYLLRDIIKFAQTNKSAFMSYKPPVNPSNILDSKEKISYVTLFEDWNWVIGSGFYMEDLNKIIKRKKDQLTIANNDAIKQFLTFSIVFTIVFIFISFYLSKLIKKRFDEYKQNIQKELENSIEKEKLLIQQSKMATMGEMLSNIAHQWKQPISVISMSNSLLRMNNEPDNDFVTEKDVNLAIDNIDNSTKNLIQTMDDFRGYFSPNKEKVLFNVKSSIEETFKLISTQFKNNNIEIIESIDDLELYGSQNELQQVLINIIKNAKEELVKKDSSKKRLIFINSYKDSKNNITIEIKDNAGGIPNEIIDNIFDSYFTTKEEDGGTGIGLYMSKQIIENSMEGTISVSNTNYSYENIDYVGAEFKIIIPIK